MKPWPSAEAPCRAIRIRLGWAHGIWIGALMLAWSVAADAPSPQEPPAEPIRITADRLVSDSNNRTAEFSGNVTAVQAQTTITADRLTLTYGEGGDQERVGTDHIDTIEARGHVRITFDNRVAVSEKAVYTTIDRKLVLTGPGSTITSGQDVITGNEITFHRDQGRVEIVGDDKNPVKATIHSGQSGLD